MKTLNYIGYVLASVFIPQSIVTYGVAKGIWNDINIWLVVGLAGLSSAIIFLTFAIIDIRLERKIKKENARSYKN